MKAMHRGHRDRAAGLLRLSLLALLSGMAMFAGGRPTSGLGVAEQAAAPPRKPTTAYVGAEYCKKCHREPTASRTDLSRLTEYHYWENEDRHRIAWSVLQGLRARQMGVLLNGKDGNDVSRDARCIACHAIDTSKLAAAPPNQLVEQFNYTTAEGISCVECHGPAIEWVAYHGLPTREWRHYPREKKEQEYGMKDLWNPFTRTKVCLSCHLGDPEKGRFVTHEMYAAGHPPLPGFEVAAFSDEMPRHWEYLGEKYSRIDLGTADKKIKQMLGIRPDRLERTELIAVSGMVTLRESLEQFATQAGTRDQSAARPEFARYDCYACHHDLRTSDRSWRQEAPPAGTPGRPRVASWPAALASLSLIAADPQNASRREEEFQSRMRAFHVAISKRPFGSGPEVAEAIASLKEWSNPIVRELRELTRPEGRDPKDGPDKRRLIDRPTAIAMLGRLCELADGPIGDYDASRQMAWACRAIYHEITPKPAKDDPVVAELKRLQEDFDLSLRSRSSPGASFPTRPDREPIVDSAKFPRRLEAVADFDPPQFRVRFRAIAQHLPKS